MLAGGYASVEIELAVIQHNAANPDKAKAVKHCPLCHSDFVVSRFRKTCQVCGSNLQFVLDRF